jgi:hypothetical protein
MWVRVRDDGRVRVRLGSGSRYHVLPVLRGRLEGGPGGGVRLDAVVRESLTEAVVPGLFGALAAGLGLVAFGIAVAGQMTNPGLYVCGVGALALGSVAVALRRARRSGFANDAERVVRAARSRLLHP